jgi:hypothetical protein
MRFPWRAPLISLSHVNLLLGPDIFLSTLSSNTVSMLITLCKRVWTHTKQNQRQNHSFIYFKTVERQCRPQWLCGLRPEPSSPA